MNQHQFTISTHKMKRISTCTYINNTHIEHMGFSNVVLTVVLLFGKHHIHYTVEIVVIVHQYHFTPAQGQKCKLLTSTASVAMLANVSCSCPAAVQHLLGDFHPHSDLKSHHHHVLHSKVAWMTYYVP